MNLYYSFPCRLLAHSCAARRLTRGMWGPTCHGNGKGPGDGTASGTTVLGVADKGPDPSRGAQRMPANIRVHHRTPALLDGAGLWRARESNRDGPNQRDEKKPRASRCPVPYFSSRTLLLCSAGKRPTARIAVTKNSCNGRI